MMFTVGDYYKEAVNIWAQRFTWYEMKLNSLLVDHNKVLSKTLQIPRIS